MWLRAAGMVAAAAMAVVAIAAVAVCAPSASVCMFGLWDAARCGRRPAMCVCTVSMVWGTVTRSAAPQPIARGITASATDCRACTSLSCCAPRGAVVALHHGGAWQPDGSWLLQH